jgi:hypothetical protein
VAAVVSIARGHDPSYPFKTTGAAEGPVITGQCGAGYYFAEAQSEGVPHLARQQGRCAARRRPWATTDTATRGRGWRLDGRSG